MSENIYSLTREFGIRSGYTQHAMMMNIDEIHMNSSTLNTDSCHKWKQENIAENYLYLAYL